MARKNIDGEEGIPAMKEKRYIIWITIALILIAVSAAFAYGKIKADSAADTQKSYFDTLNEYDWSKTCPGASCRSKNEQKTSEDIGKESIGEKQMKTIYLAGGCFWGVQKYFDQFEGVEGTEVGYANGPDKPINYTAVCGGSGHAETVKVTYNETRISLTELLEYYFMVSDPLSVNRQGNDRGIQYRTGIYYTDESQVDEIEKVYAEEETKAGAKLAVELKPLQNFYPAEEYHQKYLDKNPGGYCHIPRSMFNLQK